LTFSSDSQRLIAGCLDGCVRVVQLPEGQSDDASLTVTHTFNQHLSAPAVATLSDSASVSSETSKSSVKAKRKGAPSPALAPLPSPSSSLTSAGSLSLPSTAASSASTSRLIRSLCVSVDGQWIASGDVSDRIHVFHVSSNHIQHHASLPALSALFMMADNSSTSKSVTCTHTSMSFHPTKPLLAIACSSNHFLLYDVAQRCLADYSKQTLGNFPAHVCNFCCC
jgi:WD40 repeat protein